MRWGLTCLVGAVLLGGCNDRGPTKATATFESLAAERLGNYVSEALSEETVVLWIHQQLPAVLAPRRDALADALENGGHSLVDVALPEAAVIPGMGGPLGEDWLASLAREHSAGALILCAEGVSAFGSKPPRKDDPPVFAYLWNQNDTRVEKWFKKGQLRGGVFIKGDADWSKMPKDTGDEDERFSWRYLLLSAE